MKYLVALMLGLVVGVSAFFALVYFNPLTTNDRLSPLSVSDNQVITFNYSAVATDALFVREIFTGVYTSDFGLWNTNCGEVIRHQHHIGGENVKLMFNIVPEAASYLGQRDVADIARSTVFNTQPDALCVSGLTAGSETDASTLKKVKDAVPDTPVFANTGVSLSNVKKQLAIADGTVTATTFKRDGVFENEVDQSRVTAFMDVVRRVRKENG